jgi:hypothetical protein
MARRLTLLLLIVPLASCGGHTAAKQAARGCKTAPHELKGRPTLLPRSFPSPARTAYTAQRKQGRSTIVAGFLNAGVSASRTAYTSALPKAGYHVKSSRRVATGADLRFSGSGTVGDIRLVQVCNARTNLTITLRKLTT